MTTIACNNKTMAGDSAVDDDGCKSLVTKIYKVDKHIIGFAGSLTEGLKFVHWYKDKRKDKPSLTDTEALVLRDDGKIEYWDEAMFYMILDVPFIAIGSGKSCAQGAMYAGATPEEAVNISCEVDQATGYPVTVLER